MSYFERKKRQYRYEKQWKLYGILVYVLHRKCDKNYWEEGGIEETRQKRQRISRDGTASRDETISTDDTSTDDITNTTALHTDNCTM